MADVISAQNPGDHEAGPGGHGLSDQDPVALIELMFFAYRDFVSDPDEILD